MANVEMKNAKMKFILAFFILPDDKKRPKAKGAVKSKTGQKIKGALMEDKAFMKEFNKAKKQLMDYL